MTGATGFIASHIIKQLLEANCKVIGTVRKIDSVDVENLKKVYGSMANRLSFEQAELTQPKGWKEIVSKCDYVCHVASPVFFGSHSDYTPFLQAATNGTKFVMEACVENKTKKVVMTSSIAAIHDIKNR